MFISAGLRFMALLCLCLWTSWPGPLQAAAVDKQEYNIVQGDGGTFLEFIETEFAIGRGKQAPETGWKRRPLPATRLTGTERSVPDKDAAVWMRFSFDQPQPGPLAIGFDRIGERFRVNLNGVEISRNHADDAHVVYGWNRPWMAHIPAQLLRARDNELTVRLDTRLSVDVGIGDLRIGPSRAIKNHFDLRYLVQVQMPRILNWLLLAQASIVLFTWLHRRKEWTILWCGVTCVLWWFVNLHYYLDGPPFDAALFGELTAYAIFPLIFTLFGMAATFANLTDRHALIGRVALAVASLIALRVFLGILHLDVMICYWLIVPLAFMILFIFVRAAWRNPHVCEVAMAASMFAAIASAFHDFGIVRHFWSGATFFLLPYAGVSIIGVWVHARWVRMVEAMNEVDDLNLTLEQRIFDATIQLEESEDARREMQVASAIEHERERLMLEMHDRIGSGLVSALAVAENRGYPADTVATLKSSLLDLRLAVDSLEPIDGDLALLLASYRHRVEHDLVAASLRFDWQVEAVPPLDWLNAENALHVLRIFQEAIANILSHAQANIVTVICRSQKHCRTGSDDS